MRIRKRVTIFVAIVLLLSVNVSIVFAAPPEYIEITAIEAIGVGGLDPFTATGPAVTAGTVCASGDVEDLTITVVNTNGPIRVLSVTKRFYCADLSGTFDVSMTVQLDLNTNYTKAHWKIIGGTGNYQYLKGNGLLEGEPIIPGTSITDYYYGKVH